MALLDKYNQNASTLSGPKSPQTPVGATDESKLHDQYSLNGAPKLNGKPVPSTLDLNGIKPKGSLSDKAYGTLNNTFKKGTYRDNLPDGASF
jgi:hypothetical protein